MKTYCFCDQGFDEPIEKTEDEILKDYYDYWSNKIIEIYGKEKFESDFTKEDCIMDWVVINWAWIKQDV